MAKVLRIVTSDHSTYRVLEDLDGSDTEQVFRAKFDLDNRPGCHFTLKKLREWSEFAEPLLEAYSQHVSPFDGKTVYWRVFDDQLLSQLGQPDYKHFIKWRNLWKTEIRKCAKAFGGWIGTLDFRSFYLSVSPKTLWHCLGRSGLGIDPDLIAAVSAYVEHYGLGLPQSSFTSDIVSRLILGPCDRAWADASKPVIRWQDDVCVFGSCREEVQEQQLEIIQDIRSWGFSVKESKTNIEPPSRIEWIANGIVWGEVPIERYQQEFISASRSIAGGEGYCCHPAPDADQTIPALNVETLYEQELAPGKHCRSESGMRVGLQSAAREMPDRIWHDCAELITRNVTFALPMVKGMKKRKDEFSLKCIQLCPERSSIEDDRLQIAESTHCCQAKLARYLLEGEGISGRAQRQGAIARLSKNEQNLALASNQLSRNPWVDEVAAFADLATAIGGTCYDIARSLVEKIKPQFGLTFEALQHA